MSRFKTIAITIAALLSPVIANACAVCGGDPNSEMTAGMNAGIISLLIIIGLVLSMFVTFFIYLWRRHRKLEQLSVEQRWLNGMRRMTNA